MNAPVDLLRQEIKQHKQDTALELHKLKIQISELVDAAVEKKLKELMGPEPTPIGFHTK